MKIAFTDFWWKFENDSNFFIDSIREIREGVEVVDKSKADLLVYSCFGSDHKTVDSDSTKKLYFTGENTRPNFEECDTSLTFDFDDHGGKNERLPLWMLQYDWYNSGGYVNPKFLMPVEWIKKSPLWEVPKNNFCVAIFNRDHIGNRVEFLQKIASYKKSHGFGEPFKNWFYGEDQKLNILSQFRFTMCFENTLQDGYHTEKLVHAKAAGCIPIYWANDRVADDFNPNAFINLHDYESVDEMIDVVKKIDSDPKLQKNILDSDLFAVEPSKQQILSKFESCLRIMNL